MRVSKWGNSLAVRLPSALVEALGLKEGAEIEISIVGKRDFKVARDQSKERALSSSVKCDSRSLLISSSTAMRSMNRGPFLDTNVVIHAFRKDDPRSQVAETLLAAGGEICVRILNEFVAVARRKLHKSWEEVGRALAILRVFRPEPLPLTIDTHERALQFAKRCGYSNFDWLW
jgi:predicted nucleic acid-binding protein